MQSSGKSMAICSSMSVRPNEPVEMIKYVEEEKEVGAEGFTADSTQSGVPILEEGAGGLTACGWICCFADGEWR
ncbi:hypothetical protein PoB_005863200 [Plakobranchus ocellatus]|uniref:Uncharacterized protein n=1 Tax=Plakobranchus ocellatus TaxID=259542 RepID=A0AAV4CK92_9GAST|nr:hypothetical protein PoB_005863200 [Plakobranchus ocellatus]